MARLFGASVVITGTPQASASRAAIPKPSRSEGITQARAPLVLASSLVFSSGISVGTPGNNTLYRPFISLGNLQTINLSGVSNNHYFDYGWVGAVNIVAGAGLGDAVQVGSQLANTTFVLTNFKITTNNGALGEHVERAVRAVVRRPRQQHLRHLELPT